MNIHKANIVNALMLANQEEIDKGKLWYHNARKICRGIAKETDTKFIKVCGVLAALSPFCSWEQNVKDTRNYIINDKYKPVTFGSNREKADKILLLEKPTIGKIKRILRGQKISRFFLNVYSRQYNVVTIDRHAISLYFGSLEYKFVETPKRIQAIREDFKAVANEFNLRPYQLQAVVWLVWKRLIGGEK